MGSHYEKPSREPKMNQRVIRDTARVEAFSDGVIAVAITLLVLDIHVPNVNPAFLLADLMYQWPMYLGYLTSFLVIGIFWANHHNMFCYIECVDHVLLLINTCFLMCIVFIPFSTSLMTEYVNVPSAEHIVSAIYSATLFLNGLFFNAIWWYSTSKSHLLYKNIGPQDRRKLTISYLIGLPVYLISFFISLVNVEASMVLYIIVAIVYSLPNSMRYIDCKPRH